MGKIPTLSVHPRCRKHTSLDGLLVLAHCRGIVRTLITDAKYHGAYTTLFPLSTEAAAFIKNHHAKILPRLAVVTPIPLSNAKERARGFNQSALIAKGIATDLLVPYLPNLLEKVKEASTQASLARRDRFKNVESVYRSRVSIDTNQTILLIDDVVTTGATLNACAKALKNAGARTVIGLALAHGK